MFFVSSKLNAIQSRLENLFSLAAFLISKNSTEGGEKRSKAFLSICAMGAQSHFWATAGTLNPAPAKLLRNTR